MLEVTVKTLDGKNTNFSVQDDITVQKFKEEIAASIEISADSQRLIFIGRVLQDEKKLNDYDVNGKTIHVVERPPPGVRNQGADNDVPSTTGPHSTHSHNVMVGSFQIPSQGGEHTNVENIVQQALNGIGNMGRNARVSTRTSADGSSVDVHINLGQVQLNRERPESEGQRRISGARKMIARARQILDRIENPNASASTSTSSTTSETQPTTSTGETTTNQDGGSTTTTEGATSGVQVNVGSQRIDDSLEGDVEDDLDVEAIAIVTETVEAEIQMETDDSNEGAITGTLRIPAGAASNTTVEVQAEPTVNENATQTNPNVNTSAQTEEPNTQPEHPPPSAYADVLDEVFELNRRLQPHLERYQGMLREDPNFQGQDHGARDAQKFYNQISSVMHYVSHAYHSLSDLMIDMNHAPPRQMRATPVPMSAVMQHAIPIQTSVSMVQVPVNVGSQAQATSSTTTGSTGTSTTGQNTPSSTSTSTSTSSSTPGTATHSVHMSTSSNATPGSTSHTTTQRTSTTFSSTGPFVPNQANFPMPQPGTFAAGTGRPPFMPPDVFENIIRMATSAATASAQQHFPGGTPGGARPQGQAFVIRQPGGMPIPVNLPGSTPAAPTTPNPPRPTPQTSPGTTPRAANPPPRQPGVQQPPRGVTIAIPQGGIPGLTGGIPGLPGGIPGLPGGIPGLPGGIPGLPGGLPGINAVDPLLPCHSRHFLTRRAVNMARQGAGRGANTVNNAGPDALAGMVSNLVGGLMGQNPQAANASTTRPSAATTAGNQATRQPVTNPFAALFGGNVSTPVPGSAPTSQPAVGGFMDQLRSVLELGQTLTPSAPTPPPSQPPGGASRQTSTGFRPQPVTDDMFAQLVSGIGQYVGQATAGQPPSGNISDFLQSLGESYVTPQGESILTDIFNVVSQSINIVDLMQLFSGVSTSLQRTREPLQRYIRETLMKGEEPTQENIDQCINRLMADGSPYLEQACAELETVDDIDFEATASTFLENHLQDLVVFIMNSTESDTDFHVNLYTRIRRLFHEAIILGENCLQGGFQAVTRLVRTRVGEMSTDVNPLIRQWMSDVTVQQLTTLRPNITVTVADIHPYIVKKSHHDEKMETCSKSSEENEDFMSADEEAPEVEKRLPEAGDNKPDSKSAHKTHAKATPTCSTSSHTATTTQSAAKARPKVEIPRGPKDRIKPRVAPEGGEHPPRQTEGSKLYTENGEIAALDYSSSAARLRPQMTPMAYHTVRCAAKPDDDNTPANVRLGSEDWHSVVPQEWVSVITKDIERQKEQVKQKPHSDAYHNGNPAKKRKMTRFSKTESEQLSQPESSLPEALQFSAGVVQAQPITSQQSLTQDIAASATLQEAFHQEVRNEVRKKLRDDKDLVPYKYRNTEKYFGNKK